MGGWTAATEVQQEMFSHLAFISVEFTPGSLCVESSLPGEKSVREHSLKKWISIAAMSASMADIDGALVTCLAGRPQRSWPNSILGRIFGEPNKKHCF